MTKKHRKWYDRMRVHTIIRGESRTDTTHFDSSDVNSIVERFQRTGELPPNPRGLEPRYEDVTGLQENLTDAYNKSTQITERYHQLVAEGERTEESEETTVENTPLPSPTPAPEPENTSAS